MLIGVDWGTTRLRAALIGSDGIPVARVESEDGLASLAGGDFEAALTRLIGGWLSDAPGAPILMAGMVGSRQGWREAPYVPAPARLKDLAAAVTSVPAAIGDVAIVPGVAVGIDDGAWADVMRGEETEVFGALAHLNRADARLVLPGTHAKWVTVEDGAVTGFRTFMTGDVFAAVGDHTILSKSLGRDKGDRPAFIRGVEAARALTWPGDLLARLFSVRAEGLMGRLGDDAAASFLSGLLIGAEVCAGAAVSVRGGVVVVGAPSLAERYLMALDALGIPATHAPRDCAARGLALIAAARAAGAEPSAPAPAAPLRRAH